MVVDIYKKYISYVDGKRNNTLEEFLDNKELFFNAYFSYAITSSSSQFNTIDNLFMIDVMEEEIIKRIKNSDKNIINKVISIYSSLYKEEPTLIVSSRIYRECLDIFPDNIVKSINKTNNNLKDLVDRITKKYLNREEIDDEYFYFMILYLSNNIGDNNILIDKVIREYYRRDKNYDRFYDLIFKYIVYNKCISNNMPIIPVYYGIDDSDKYTGVYIDGMVYIAINDKLYKNNSYKNLTRIVTLCHEFCHYRQEYEARSGQVSSSAFNYIKCSLSSKLHTTDKFREYDVNYKYKDSELEAEAVGITDGLDFAGEYFSDREYDKVKDSLKDRLVRSYSFYNNNMQEENCKNISIRRDGEAYAIESIGTMISKKRSMFDEYPQLKKFYDKNGKVFSPIKIIDFYLYKYYSSNGCNMSHDVYREFFYYSIKRYELEDVYKNTSLINRKLFCVFLNEIIEDLAIDIDMMISYKLYKEDSDNLFKSISDFNRFYDFMMKYRLIDKSHISIIERSKNIISSYNSNVK